MGQRWRQRGGRRALGCSPHAHRTPSPHRSQSSQSRVAMTRQTSDLLLKVEIRMSSETFVGSERDTVHTGTQHTYVRNTCVGKRGWVIV